METRFLETFLTVIEHGSLAEASRRLGITPAAVAQRIQALEDEIGVALLARAGRRVQATSAGLAIAERSRQILTDVRHLRILATQDAPSGELRLGAVSTALTGLLAPALSRLRESVPNVEVFLLPGTSATLYQQLVDGGIDAALLVEPPFPILKTFDWRLLRSEATTLLAPRAWAHEDVHELLATRPSSATTATIGAGASSIAICRTPASPRANGWSWISLEAIAVMVANGLGIALVPEWARTTPDSAEIVRLRLPLPAEPRRVGMLWPRNSATSRLVEVLIEVLGRKAA